MQIAHQNWPAVEHYLTTRSVLLIPIGSTEQHGPNGLIGTDHLVAESLARSVGEEMGILVAPTLAYGMSHHHLAFPGSASLSPETLIRVIRDVVTSFARNGFSRFSSSTDTAETSVRSRRPFRTSFWTIPPSVSSSLPGG